MVCWTVNVQLQGQRVNIVPSVGGSQGVIFITSCIASINAEWYYMLSWLCCVVNKYFVTWKYLRLRYTTWTGRPFLFGKSFSSVRFAHVLCVATGVMGASYGMCDASEVSVRLYVVPHETNPTCSRACACKETASSWSRGSVLPLITEDRGFKPGRSRQDFSGRKIPQHAFLRKGSKAVGPMS